MTAGDEIEFLDVIDVSDGSAVEAVASDRSHWRKFVAAALLVGCGWIVASIGADDSETEPASDTLPSEPEARPEAVADREPQAPLIDSDRDAAVAIERPDSGIWPSPRERDPNVTRTVGPTLLPPEFATISFRATSLVYVATSGLPTVVSLETGDVLTVGVAAIRVHDTFAVEAGQVVPAEAASDPTRTAFVFHSYRDVDGPGVGRSGNQRGVGVGPELCLSGETCRAPSRGLDRQHRNGVVVERFEPQRHRPLDDLLSRWERVDGTLMSPDGYRLPEPVGVIWVISPASGGSVSSSGLL